jgi:hypothetical protein
MLRQDLELHRLGSREAGKIRYSTVVVPVGYRYRTCTTHGETEIRFPPVSSLIQVSTWKSRVARRKGSTCNNGSSKYSNKNL